jgi:hypothetical protein
VDGRLKESLARNKYLVYAKRVLEHPGPACRVDNLALSRRAPFILLQHKHTHMNPLRMGKPEVAEEGMGPMDKGRHRYAKGDYAGALVAFTQVFTSPSRSHLVAHWSSYMYDDLDHSPSLEEVHCPVSFEFDHLHGPVLVTQSLIKGSYHVSKTLLTLMLGCKLQLPASFTQCSRRSSCNL